ncbi:hypothetical protein VTN77DRAFT_8941 [Rasamsonia byssochlamydoides]|uniref:uncharacterized protein n=1 Tax=Rasamsonia byssochlamydoides TaxID=89139 RepID=UPI003743060F
MGSLSSANMPQPGQPSENRDHPDPAHLETSTTGPAEPNMGPGGAFTAIFQHIRELFTFHDLEDDTLCLLFQDWTKDWTLNAASCQVVPPPPGFSFEPGKHVYDEPLKNGYLLVCLKVPADYPGGKRGFFAIVQEFLHRRDTFGIKALYLQEPAIERFLSSLKDDFKAKAKATGKNKGKGAKGKRLKWKNPFTAFGCRVVWAHDLSNPEPLYLRVRCVDRDTSALVVVDTNDDAYKIGLSSDKTKFINVATLQLHLQLLIVWWQTYFQRMAIEHLGAQSDQATPADQWWWSVIQGHHGRYHEQPVAAETHGDLTTKDTHGELPMEETPRELMNKETPENLMEEIEELTPLANDAPAVFSAVEKAPIASEAPVAKLDDHSDLQQELPAAEVSSSQTQKSKNKKKKNKKKKKGNQTAQPGQTEPDTPVTMPVAMPQEASSHSISSIAVHEPATASQLPSDTMAQSTEPQQQAAITGSQSTSIVVTLEASKSLDASSDQMPAFSLIDLLQDITTFQPHDGHDLTSESTPVEPIPEEAQATEATEADKSTTFTAEEAATLVEANQAPEPSSLSHEHHSIEDTPKPAKATATSEQTHSDASLLEENPAASNKLAQIETASDLRPSRYRQHHHRHTKISSSTLYTIPESESGSHTEDDNESKGHKLPIEKDQPVSQGTEPSKSAEENIPRSAQPSPKKNKKNKKKNRRSTVSELSTTEGTSTTDTSNIVTRDSNTTSTKTQDARAGSRSARNARRPSLRDHSTQQGHSTQQDHSTQRGTHTPSSAHSHIAMTTSSHISHSESNPQQAGDQRDWNVVSRTRKSQPSSSARHTTEKPQQGEISRSTVEARPSQNQGRRTSSKVTTESQSQKTSESTTSTPTVSHPPPVLTDADFPPLPSQKKPQQEQGSTSAATQGVQTSESSPSGDEKTSSSTTADIERSCETETTVRSVEGDDDQTRLKRDEAKPSPAVSAQATNDETAPAARQQRETTSQPLHDRGALPSPSSASSSQTGQQRQRPEGWFWQLKSHGFPCALAGCDKRCSSWDGASVICPRCGPYSEVRYCGEGHLFADVKAHWPHCGQMTFRHPCREESIPRQQREGPPLLPSRHNWDTPERHRQAVRHAVDRSGDYFIFSDWADWMAAGQPDNILDVRCSNRVVWVVSFDDREDKDRFRRVLGVCLFASIEVVQLVGFLFRMIRDNLHARGVWTGELDAALRYQMKHELAVSLLPGTTGTRHACATDWDGRSRRACPDPVCQAEYVPLLGDMGRGMGLGFRRLCDYWESNFWLLRAARLTHPHVPDVAARTCGEGYDEVLPEDRRLFRRGEGWDGAGTGPMEIEGPQF